MEINKTLFDGNNNHSLGILLETLIKKKNECDKTQGKLEMFD